MCTLVTFKWQHKKPSFQARLYVPGMLLELPVPALSQMLQDEATLTTAVEKALRALHLPPQSRYSNEQGGVARPDLLPLSDPQMWVHISESDICPAVV